MTQESVRAVEPNDDDDASRPTPDPLTNRPRSLPRAHLRLLKIAFALCVAIAVWWFVWISLGAHQRTHWSHNVLVPTGILAVACLTAFQHERYWAGPVRRLLLLLPRVRAGEAPIDELVNIKGGLVAVVPQLQELLHDLRQQKQAVAELHEEIRQRIATRTDALERKIGSLRQQAVRDGLTSLHNRRMLDEFLPQLMEKCRDERTDLCLMMIDLDDFKLLNDTLGHCAGDDFLRDVGRLIRSSVRDQDAAFRYGGDEFAIVLPGATLEAAQSLGERLASLVDALTRPLRVDRKPRLSIGFAMRSSLKDPSVANLLAQADKSLYEAKTAHKAQKPAAPMYA